VRNFVFACLAASLLGGCGTLIKDRSQVPISPVGGFGTSMGSPKTMPPTSNGSTPWRNADVVTLDLPLLIGRYSGSSRTPPSLEDALAGFDSHGTAAERAEARNAIVGAVLLASDKNCDVYLEYLHGNQIAIKGITSVAATVLGGAASVTTPERSSHLLAAIGSAATGVGGNLSEAVFSNRAVDVIVSGIRSERASLRTEIQREMKTESYADWPLSIAMADGLKYHGRCNAISGLAYLQGTAETNKSTSETGHAPGQAQPAAPAPGATTTTTTTAPVTH